MSAGTTATDPARMNEMNVNADTFARAETDRMFTALAADAGGVNRLNHSRTPTPLTHQPVIRMNRDTLYSAAVVDVSEGAVLTLPDTGGRYLSAMVVNRDHYVNAVLHEPGGHELTTERYDTDYVLVAIRTLVDPADPDDVVAVNALQDRIALTAASARPFTAPVWDAASLDRTRAALLGPARGMPASTVRSGRARTSIPSVTSSGRLPGGVGCHRVRRPTSTSIPACRRGSTSSRFGTCRSTASGRSRSTTQTASSNRTTATRTA
jgi:hypothetical protein